jgi:class 3 adenylate cyclase/tetratricopeptide (TPR) repeat protein
MKCPNCSKENPDGNKFCRECGTEFALSCSKCGSSLLVDDKFCGQCGQKTGLEQNAPPKPVMPDGERKHVTVIFSDLSGYTAMSEKLDPEEVKEITSRIFGEIAKIVARYDGFIEKYIGDAVMAIFGIPKAHEDDPIRAVKAVTEIHEMVEVLSPEVEKRIGRPLTLHTGINTGLVVTGEVDLERGTHGIAGDTINLASRLSSLANPGDILIDQSTCSRVEGHYRCQFVKETVVKGKKDPVQVYEILHQRQKPVTVHRLSGLRADLVGRNAELGRLSEAVGKLSQGRGSIFSINGAAGTGKSRLVQEFKSTLDLEEIQWVEGHAYGYAQNIPYFPLVDMLNRVFQIEESDPARTLKKKLEAGIARIVGKGSDIVPYVGELYSLGYSSVAEVSPEYLKSRLHEAIRIILTEIARKAPTIFLLEDLHWADPSFVDLLRQALSEVREPAIVICTYRPVFNLFTSHQLESLNDYYSEMRLSDLSSSETREMLASLLDTGSVPSDLERIVQSKVEGNPFFLEEYINSLIESEMLFRENGKWKTTKSLDESSLPVSIHSLIAGRLDRLEKETKRILQEASVIGRAFLYEILTRITEVKGLVDQSLSNLERLDLIRARSLQPEIEYVFKHALTQEVVYEGLLKKERREIHERIGTVIETIFQDRLSEFYEILAFHFKRAKIKSKAVDYLIKSGEKSLKRYAVDESHQYYNEAFQILSEKPNPSQTDHRQILNLLFDWALVFYYRGDFKTLDVLLRSHKNIAVEIDDDETKGMFFAWLGFAKYFRGEADASYKDLKTALEFGEKTANQKIIGYACTWLPFSCASLGLLDEAIQYGEKAHRISKVLSADQYLYFKSLSGLGLTYWFRGEGTKALETGKIILAYGERHSNIRSIVMGHWVLGQGYLAKGEFEPAIASFKDSANASKDQIYSMSAKHFLAIGYILSGQYDKAESLNKELMDYGQSFGCEFFGDLNKAFLGVVQITQGHMSKGASHVEAALRTYRDNNCETICGIIEYMLGKIYSQIATGPKPGFSIMAKNIVFLLKTVPHAAKKAEEHFNLAIDSAKATGAKGTLGMAYLDLGVHYIAMKDGDQARACISEAIETFAACEASGYLKRAEKVMSSI